MLFGQRIQFVFRFEKALDIFAPGPFAIPDTHTRTMLLGPMDRDRLPVCRLLVGEVSVGMFFRPRPQWEIGLGEVLLP